MDYNNHYIVIDGASNIVGGWSDGPHPNRDTEGAILLNRRGSYQFRLFDGGEENPQLFDEYGVPRYKWEDYAVVERPEQEMEADRPEETEPSDPADNDSVWDELDAAYQEGVDSV